MAMDTHARDYQIRLAETEAEVLAAQRLRYLVFAQELGATGPTVDHVARTESDPFDAIYDHLLLIDQRDHTPTAGQVVGVYRLLRSDVAAGAGGFYSATEYDLGPLLASGRPLLELGRSCVHPDHRGGPAMYHMWNALADYVLDHGVEVMFGVASFHGTDVGRYSDALSYLHHHHLAPPELRVSVRPEHRTDMALKSADQTDRRAAMTATPALIKAYLRLGGFVGEGAYIDHDFNTIDVCLLMDTARMSARHKGYYTGRQGRGS